MTTEFAAHVITAESDLASGHPDIVVMIHDSEMGEAIPVATYPLSDGDDPAELLWENGWRVLDDPSQVELVDVGYGILTVEPVDDNYTIDGMAPDEWFYAMTM